MLQYLKSTARPQAPINNPLGMLSEFRKFAQGITAQDAKAQVERLLQSGEMTQQQFEQLKQQAESLAGFLK